MNELQGKVALVTGGGRGIGRAIALTLAQTGCNVESYASLLIVERNTSVGNVPMCSASQTAFSTFSDQLLESANLRKIHILAQELRKREKK